MKRLRKFSDFSILPVIVWLTLQIFLSTQTTQASPALAGVSGDGKNAATEYVEVVICTQYGFKTIKITADGAVPEEKKETSSDCRLCQSFCTPAIDLFRSADASPVIFSSIALLSFQTIQVHLQTPELSPFRSRAPPL